jgi:hypothetical protein
MGENLDAALTAIPAERPMGPFLRSNQNPLLPFTAWLPMKVLLGWVIQKTAGLISTCRRLMDGRTIMPRFPVYFAPVSTASSKKKAMPWMAYATLCVTVSLWVP